MSTNSGRPDMSVLQYPASKRSAALLAFVTMVIIALCMPLRASAESSVLSDPETNVFFRFGASPEFVSEGYTYDAQIYRHGRFVNTASGKFGYMSLKGNNHEEATGVALTLPADEKITEIETDYLLSNDTQLQLKWDGKGLLPIYRRIGSSKAKLIYVAIGAHSSKLANQPEEPEYTGMH
jgi:hypothetical protein